jgi:hypothetical protein
MNERQTEDDDGGKSVLVSYSRPPTSRPERYFITPFMPAKKGCVVDENQLMRSLI